MTSPTQKRAVLLFVLLAVGGLCVASGVLILRLGILQQLFAMIQEDLPTLPFVLLAIALPAVGFPISVFLLVAGIKFGTAWGVGLLCLIYPLHTSIAYVMARFFRPFIEKLLFSTMGYRFPTLPEKSHAMFSFLFLALPGLPYAAKNYLLPLADVPLKYCVGMNCLVQGVLGVPFIMMGASGATMDMRLFSIALFGFVLLFVLVNWLKRRYQSR